VKNLISILIVTLLAPIGYSQSSKVPDLKPYFVAIIVSNIDASSQWYSDVLGFETLNRVDMEERGIRQENLKRGNATIELIETKTAIYPKDILEGKAKKTKIAGYFKIGFSVSDFDKWENFLTKSDVEIYGSVVRDQTSKKRIVIILDPDGNRIQLFEE